jgi:hypothetical protein
MMNREVLIRLAVGVIGCLTGFLFSRNASVCVECIIGVLRQLAPLPPA